jgi:hypothetical protein
MNPGEFEEIHRLEGSRWGGISFLREPTVLDAPVANAALACLNMI